MERGKKILPNYWGHITSGIEPFLFQETDMNGRFIRVETHITKEAWRRPSNMAEGTRKSPPGSNVKFFT